MERLGSQWSAGQQLPPVRELAAMLGIAPGTAHRALRKLTAEGLLKARPRTGVFVTDQFTDAQLRDLCRRRRDPKPQTLRNRTIEVVYVESHSDTFISRMVQVFVNEIKRRGGDIRRNVIERAITHIDVLDCRGVDGFAVFTPHVDDNLVPGHVPLVWATTSFDEGPRQALNYDVVSVDQFHGGMLAADALRATGCARVCVLGRGNAAGEPIGITLQRARGFSEAWDDDSTLGFLPTAWYGQIPGARSVADYLAMDPRPTGIFATSDELAVGFVHGAAAHGLVAGRDYSIVGFDGQDIAQRLEGGPLATVCVPILELGRLAAETLERRLSDHEMSPQRILLRCSMIDGPTAPAKQKQSS